MTTVIGLYGGPGTGKSTRAASLYAQMKEAGVNCELVREYVKDWAWEGKKIGKYDQMYFLVQQFKRETILYNKVDYVITDSPFLLAGFYAKHYLGQEFIAQAAFDMRKLASEEGVVFNDFFLERYKEYNPNGRYESEDEAKNIDTEILAFLKEYNVSYTHIKEPDDKKNNAIIKNLIPFHSLGGL